MNLGMPEMLFILLMALVVFGPRKLPELARQLGKFMGEFKRASNEFKQQLEAEIDSLDQQERQQKIVPPEREAAASRPAGTVINSLMTPAEPAPAAEEAVGYEPSPVEMRSSKITTPGGELVPLPPPDASKLNSYLRPAEPEAAAETVHQVVEQYSPEHEAKGPNA